MVVHSALFPVTIAIAALGATNSVARPLSPGDTVVCQWRTVCIQDGCEAKDGRFEIHLEDGGFFPEADKWIGPVRFDWRGSEHQFEGGASTGAKRVIIVENQMLSGGGAAVSLFLSQFGNVSVKEHDLLTGARVDYLGRCPDLPQ